MKNHAAMTETETKKKETSGSSTHTERFCHTGRADAYKALGSLAVQPQSNRSAVW